MNGTRIDIPMNLQNLYYRKTLQLQLNKEKSLTTNINHYQPIETRLNILNNQTLTKPNNMNH